MLDVTDVSWIYQTKYQIQIQYKLRNYECAHCKWKCIWSHKKCKQANNVKDNLLKLSNEKASLQASTRQWSVVTGCSTGWKMILLYLRSWAFMLLQPLFWSASCFNYYNGECYWHTRPLSQVVHLAFKPPLLVFNIVYTVNQHIDHICFKHKSP